MRASPRIPRLLILVAVLAVVLILSLAYFPLGGEDGTGIWHKIPGLGRLPGSSTPTAADRAAEFPPDYHGPPLNG